MEMQSQDYLASATARSSNSLENGQIAKDESPRLFIAGFAFYWTGESQK
jgi:hypothetical protein